ncbi:MAG: type 4a pilus biogenesis protein PilO [Phycisphaerales bacterium]|nr:type 4a pilus biogenesis protein PilO [Phycisphaerales bacterium]
MRFGLREIVFFLVLLAVPAASFWFVFRPRNAEIQQAREEIREKQALLDELRDATSQTADLERANREIAQAIEVIEDKLPSHNEVEVILQDVWNVAKQCNLEPISVHTSDPKPIALAMELPLEMKIIGDFDGFYRFLLLVEQMPRITKMPQLEMKRTSQVNGFMEAKFTLSICFEPTSTAGVTP